MKKTRIQCAHEIVEYVLSNKRGRMMLCGNRVVPLKEGLAETVDDVLKDAGVAEQYESKMELKDE